MMVWACLQETYDDTGEESRNSDGRGGDEEGKLEEDVGFWQLRMGMAPLSISKDMTL